MTVTTMNGIAEDLRFPTPFETKNTIHVPNDVLKAGLDVNLGSVITSGLLQSLQCL
jgi:hypothetical protein